MNLKDLVKDRRVKFSFYREGELWYDVVDTKFSFPVPANDVGNGIFLAEDKALLYMRWIRKHLENIEAGKKEQGLD